MINRNYNNYSNHSDNSNHKKIINSNNDTEMIII